MNSLPPALDGLISPSVSHKPTDSSSPAPPEGEEATSFDQLIDSALGSETGTSQSDPSPTEKPKNKKTDDSSAKETDSTTATTTADLAVTFASQILFAPTEAPAAEPTPPQSENGISKIPAPSASTDTEIPIPDVLAESLTNASEDAAPPTTAPTTNTTPVATETTRTATVSQPLTGNIPAPVAATQTTNTTSTSQPSNNASVPATPPSVTTSGQILPTAETTSEEPTSNPEKITTESTDNGTKIPSPTASHTRVLSKTETPTTSDSTSSTSQAVTQKEDTTNRISAENTPTAQSTVSTALTGTGRAETQSMTSLRDVWSNSAFRFLAYGTGTQTNTSALASTTSPTDTILLASNDQFATAVQDALNIPRELYPRRVEIQLNTPPGAAITLSLTQSKGQVRAQFTSSNAQALQWLNSELPDLQNMNFGFAVRWSPPQLVAQQTEQTNQERHDNRRRDDERRRSTNRMDALTGDVARPILAPAPTKG